MSHNRRCRNRAPHEAHVWRGLNTRGDGYYCVGRVPPWPIDPAYPFSIAGKIARRDSGNAVEDPGVEGGVRETGDQ